MGSESVEHITRGRSNSRGEITIDNVPPGEYSIRVPGGSGLWPAGEIPPAPNIFGESKHFEVDDKDVSEIEIRVVRAATVSGFVVIEGAAGMDILARVPQMHVIAMVEFSPLMRTNIKPDGSFVFTGLRPGKLRLSFSPPPVGGPLPLRLVRTERDGVRLDSDPEIEAGDQITGLRVVLGYANSSIHGVVKLDNGPWPSRRIRQSRCPQYGKLFDGAPVAPTASFSSNIFPRVNTRWQSSRAPGTAGTGELNSRLRFPMIKFQRCRCCWTRRYNADSRPADPSCHVNLPLYQLRTSPLAIPSTGKIILTASRLLAESAGNSPQLCYVFSEIKLRS